MDYVEKVKNFFLEEFNCAQAVLSTFGPDSGLDYNICFRIATPFGAGFARRQETCGAVTGALMVLGLKYGRGTEDDINVRNKNYEIVNEFIRRFEVKHGSVKCSELLGHDMNTEEGKRIIEEKNLYETLCVGYVKDAAEILEELMLEN